MASCGCTLVSNESSFLYPVGHQVRGHRASGCFGDQNKPLVCVRTELCSSVIDALKS